MSALINKYYMAEESFLKKFCKIERFSWGSYYFWDQGQEWPKFNFIRILKKPDLVELNEIIGLHKKQGYKLNIKIDIKSDIDIFESEKLVFGGTPIVFLKTPKFTKFLNTDYLKMYQTLKVESVNDLKKWWTVNSFGRGRKNIFENPIFEKLILIFSESSSYFYIVKDNEGNDVACFALTLFDENKHYNLWGVAVGDEFQKKGVVKYIYSWIQENCVGEIYGQVNIDSPTFFLRLREVSTSVGQIEAKYEYLF